MTGTLAYILAKRVALGAVSGIKNITVDGNKIIFNLNNGTQATMIVPTPKDGVTPNIGANGNWFIDGVDTGVPATGPAGQDGNNGKDGKDGKSAYELAKDNGFAGTEQEWIESLVGADGKDGQDGISITKIEIDDNKHLIFTLSDDTTMDAGEIPTSTCDCGEMVGGGLVQAATFDDLPAAGETNILYLALDTNIMYYWNEQEQEYKAMSTGENSEWGLATEDDIDSLFDNLKDPTEGMGLATKEDIDSLFNGLNEGDGDEKLGLATEDDVDSLFK